MLNGVDNFTINGEVVEQYLKLQYFDIRQCLGTLIILAKTPSLFFYDRLYVTYKLRSLERLEGRLLRLSLEPNNSPFTLTN